MEGQEYLEGSESTARFCCKLKTVLKNKVHYLKYTLEEILAASVVYLVVPCKASNTGHPETGLLLPSS
jgi:hypothetical protein